MARAHTAGKEKHGNIEHGGGVGFVCLSFLFSVQEFANSCGGKKEFLYAEIFLTLCMPHGRVI
jgi:hypothetical protein